MANEVWCFHSHPPETGARLDEGTRVKGVVVCVHPFGLGVHLDGGQAFGHVNAPAMGGPSVQGLEDYPQVGTALDLEVLGYSGGSDQLRLRVLA
jgi:ribosomal protein S1